MIYFWMTNDDADGTGLMFDGVWHNAGQHDRSDLDAVQAGILIC
jgi:hypothetical protein